MDQRGQQTSETVEFEHYEPGAARVDRRRAPPPPTNIPLVQKAYQCPHCERSFDRPSSLQQHILVHTGEQPHVCRWCGTKRFSTTSNANRHERSCKHNPNRVSSSARPPSSVAQGSSSSMLADDYQSEELHNDFHLPAESGGQGSDLASYGSGFPARDGLPGSGGRSAYEAGEPPSSNAIATDPQASPINVRGMRSLAGSSSMPQYEDSIQPYHTSSMTSASIPLAHHVRLESPFDSIARPEDGGLQHSMMTTNNPSETSMQRNPQAYGGATSISATDVVYPSNAYSSSSPAPRFIYPSTSSVARGAFLNAGAYLPASIGISNASQQIPSIDPTYPDARSNLGWTGAAGQPVRHAYTGQTGPTTDEGYAQGASSSSNDVLQAAAAECSLEQDDPDAAHPYQYSQQ